MRRFKNGKKKALKPCPKKQVVKTEFPAISNQYNILYRLSIESRYERDVGSRDKSNALKLYHAIKSNFAQDESTDMLASPILWGRSGKWPLFLLAVIIALSHTRTCGTRRGFRYSTVTKAYTYNAAWAS